MSFVGPRPERPEMIQQLAVEIPYYEERLMVQPGILAGHRSVSVWRVGSRCPTEARIRPVLHETHEPFPRRVHSSGYRPNVLTGGAHVAADRTASPSETILNGSA